MRDDQFALALAHEGRPAARHLEQDAPERIDVGTVVDIAEPAT
jgi:hypothetical protein